MIYAIFLLMPVGLGALSLLGGVTIQLVFFVSLSWLLSMVGLWLRSYWPIVTAAVLLLLTYLTRVYAAIDANTFWRSVGFGLGLFAMLELGQDCVSIPHGKLTLAAYRRRAAYLLVIGLADVAAVFVVATLAYNAVLRYPGVPFAAATIPALFVTIGAAGVLVYRRVRRDRKR